MEPFNITTPIPRRRVADLLAAAFEGGAYGCNYWCRIMEERPPATPQTPVLGEGHRRHSYVDFPLTGGAVVCRRFEEETDEEYTPLVLDEAAVYRGLALMPVKAPKHWAAFLTEDDDATTGDVFVQLCLLGDIEYG